MTTQQQVAGFNAQDLISVNNDHLVTSSLQVAEVFGKHHKDVLKKLESLECSEEFAIANFCADVQVVEVGNGAKREFKCYQITKDGFMFLVMGFTGKKAAAIKEQYINAFNWMADRLTRDPVKYLDKIQYFNQPVLTFEMIDQAHGRIKGHAAKRFYDRHKAKFIEREDYFKVPHSEQQLLERFGLNVSKSGITLLTRSGYDKLTRRFTEFGVDHTRQQVLQQYFGAVNGSARKSINGVPDAVLMQSLSLCARWLAIQNLNLSNEVKVTELFNWRQEMGDFAGVLKDVSAVKGSLSWSGDKCKQAISLLVNRVTLERNLAATREEFMAANAQQNAKELAWARRWQLLS